MSFRTALSGLNASSTDLKVISNNIANSSTSGFKKSRTEFADVYSYAGLGQTGNAVGSGVRVNSVAQQFGQGNIDYTDNNLDLAISGAGFFIMSDGGDKVYTRAGMFGVDRNGFIVNAKNQHLQGYLADATGNITGAVGDVWLDTSDIAPKQTTTITPGINLNASASIPVAPIATSVITLSGSQLDTTTSPFVTPAFTIYDSYGTSYNNATLRFTYTGAGSLWDAELLVGGNPVSPAAIANNVNIGGGSIDLSWDPDGLAGPQTAVAITASTVGIASVGVGGSNVAASANGRVQVAFDPADGSSYNNSTSLTVYDSLGSPHLATMYYRKTGVPNIWEAYTYLDSTLINGVQANGSTQLTFGTNGALTRLDGVSVPPTTVTYPAYNPLNGAANITLTMSYQGFSQYGGGFNVTSLLQDGYSTGKLSGVSIDETGVILARFSNGQANTLAQLALANFSNNQGLAQLGDTNWSETFTSGPPLVGIPGSSNMGLVQSGALEGSNVDLTEQLVNMITAQRNYQANAQVISTMDQITQAIINIR